jgi:hypothetical protein
VNQPTNHRQATPVSARIVLLPTKAAAPIIGMSESYLEHDRMKASPEIPFVRVGRRSVRYLEADLVAYVEQQVSVLQ